MEGWAPLICPTGGEEKERKEIKERLGVGDRSLGSRAQQPATYLHDCCSACCEMEMAMVGGLSLPLSLPLSVILCLSLPLSLLLSVLCLQ
jgi:hypothetical protein